MDKKCISKCVSPCPVENIAEKNRCRAYESGKTAYITPYLQFLRCPVRKNNKVEWEKVESEDPK